MSSRCCMAAVTAAVCSAFETTVTHQRAIQSMLDVQHDKGDVVQVLSRTVPRRSFLPKSPGPDKETTLSSAWSLIGPELLSSIPPLRGIGSAAGAAPPVDDCGVAADGTGAPLPGVSRAVDWPCAPCTFVTVLLTFSSGAVCGQRARSGADHRPVGRELAFLDRQVAVRSTQDAASDQMAMLLHCPSMAQLMLAQL